jgi:hypothetical protein
MSGGGYSGHSNLMADNERFSIVNGKQIALLVAPVLCFVLAAVAVAARWYTRSVRRVNTLAEDALCLTALVCWVALSSFCAGLTFLGYELLRCHTGLYSSISLRRRLDE